ncbi:MAG: hypothetical protein M9947_03885 [Thermomicrobiales bacterium]|nr:hypothetical protein [Thermomicrobiales bacterium]
MVRSRVRVDKTRRAVAGSMTNPAPMGNGQWAMGNGQCGDDTANRPEGILSAPG